MATRSSTIDLLLDQIAQAGLVTARKMFGEYCVYLDGKAVGFVCRDQFFVKPTAAGRQLRADGPEAAPFPGIRPYLWIDPDETDHWSHREALCQLLRTTAAAVPARRSRPVRPAS